MDFALDEFQTSLLTTAQRFAADRLAPAYRAREGSGVIEPNLIRAMGRLGLIAPEVPEAHGGSGLDELTSGLVTEAIAAGDMNVAYVQIMASLLSSCILSYATPEAIAATVPGLCSGALLGSIGVTEPRGGSDAASLMLRAERDGDHYVLNGEKTSISLADQADFNLAFARTGTPEQKAHGVSAFIVDLKAPGISRSRFDDIGEKAVGRGSIFFDNVRVPQTFRVGDEGKGFVQVMQGFDFSRALIGLQCIAVARICLDETWQFIQERQAFGKPLAANQGITFPLAELETQLEGARLVCLKALWLKSQKLKHTREAAMAKWWAPKLAFDVVQQCLLIHGHGGYSTDLPFEQRMRDVFGMQIGDGTAHIMKMIIAREHVGRIG
ncbi:MAG: acyl-CoA dehydrogenase family protein [Porticoccaceae bacterium]